MASRLSELPQDEDRVAPRRSGAAELLRFITPRVTYALVALLLATLCVVAARYYAAQAT